MENGVDARSAYENDHVDVLIVGAGLSGIGAAHHLQEQSPDKSYLILEGRADMGGTWDLFRYPGIRSDSDMFTLGYRFHPWTDAKAIADGPSILAYVKETAATYGIDKKIVYNHWVTDVSWNSDTQRWTVTAKHEGRLARFTCNFLFMCSGYYKYENGYTPDFPGLSDYEGRLVHPQKWPEDLDYKNKRVLVIGSGATAVTLIPSMAEETAHITMLQRSPTFMFAMPSKSVLASFLSAFLPKSWVYRVMRWQRILLQQFVFKHARRNPEKVTKELIDKTREKLTPGFDVETHFTPSYNPWDQRICLVPDDDLFNVINEGKADIVTDHIDHFTSNGVKLKSGQEIEADIIITATGLSIELVGGAQVFKDGAPIKFADTVTYKGVMASGLPNMAFIFGYTNASWTLRSDLVADYVCRLLNHMDAEGYGAAEPVFPDNIDASEPFLDFSSGYVQRAIDKMPKQGPGVWRHPQDYFLDVRRLRREKIDDGNIVFTPVNASQNAAGKITPEAVAAE